MTKIYRVVLSTLACMLLKLTLLIGCIEFWCFGTKSFYQKQYEKNGVCEVVGISMEDLMEVTDEMLSYLQGQRSDLVVVTTLKGVRQEFFNDREKAHMKDVRQLNLNAIYVAGTALLIATLLFAAVELTQYLTIDPQKEPSRAYLFCGSFVLAACLFLGTVTLGAVIVSTDFDKYWRIFHQIFFTANDLWLLDPATDMLINIVPEAFFAALVSRIAITFVVIMVLITVFCLLLRRRIRRRRSSLLKGAALVLAFLLPISLSHPAHAEVSAPLSPNETIAAYETALLAGYPKGPEVSSLSAYLIDADTGVILYAKDPLVSHYPASTTKMMTALLAIQSLPLDRVITYSRSAITSLTPGASHIGLKTGEELTVKDSLYGLLLPSANECANGLAESVAGSIDLFVAMMNQKAESLGCVNTRFQNANGLEDPLHTTCAYDLALIARACLATPEFVNISSTRTYVIGPTNLTEENRPMKNTHRMLDPGDPYYNEYVLCGKTGYTAASRSCLVTCAAKDGMQLICVVMNAEAPLQYEDTRALLNFGFSSFEHHVASLSDLASSKATLSALQAENAMDHRYVTDSDILITCPVDRSSVTASYSEDENHNRFILYRSGQYVLGSSEVAIKTLKLSEEEPSLFEEGLLPYEKVAPLKTTSYVRLLWPLALTLIVLILLVIILFRRHREFKKRTPSLKKKDVL